MNPIEAAEAQTQREASERLEQKHRARQMRQDVQAVFAEASGRRVLMAFLTEAGIDLSPYRESAQAMGHAIGWQDAARWWLEQLRAHCPEREGQMRKESREAQPTAAQDDEA